MVAILFIMFFYCVSGLNLLPLSLNNHRFFMGSPSRLYALKPNAESVLARYKIEYNSLMENKNANSNDIDRIKELKVIFDCVEALEKIDNDLALFAEHENGSDEALKKTAQIFAQEFLMCKDQLETQLNSLLI